jgi:glyoxylase-like metal-dependent hydrolase (beta-lactamase superfamily II)
MTQLRYEVLVNDGVRRNRAQRLPDGSPIVSLPLACTLIVGEDDAVLVDPPFTREQVRRVGDWIERSGNRLAYIYATHGHGDHWLRAPGRWRSSRPRCDGWRRWWGVGSTSPRCLPR